MKLYRENGTWVLPGKQGPHATRVDIPNRPSDLVNWLNENWSGEGSPEPAGVGQPSVAYVQRPISLTDVEEFIQNAPAAPDLANVVSNACWRLKELLKEAP